MLQYQISSSQKIIQPYSIMIFLILKENVKENPVQK